MKDAAPGTYVALTLGALLAFKHVLATILNVFLPDPDCTELEAHIPPHPMAPLSAHALYVHPMPPDRIGSGGSNASAGKSRGESLVSAVPSVCPWGSAFIDE